MKSHLFTFFHRNSLIHSQILFSSPSPPPPSPPPPPPSNLSGGVPPDIGRKTDGGGTLTRCEDWPVRRLKKNQTNN